MIRMSYKIVLDHMIGERNIHPEVRIALAGNRAEDNALTNSVGTALNSRVVHLYMHVDTKQWMQDFAIPAGLDHRVIAFLNMYPGKLNDFNPEMDSQQEHSFCAPRTWENVSKLATGLSLLDEAQASICGAISAGTGSEFIQFSKVFDTLITLEDVLKKPEACEVPEDSATRWATTTMLAEKATTKNLDKILMYIDRYPIDNRIIFLRMIVKKSEELRKCKAMEDAILKLGEYING